MVELLGGQETIPGDPAHVLDISPLDVATLTQEGFGPSPAESQAIIDEAQRQRDIIKAAEWEASQREKLAVMEATAEAQRAVTEPHPAARMCIILIMDKPNPRFMRQGLF